MSTRIEACFSPVRHASNSHVGVADLSALSADQTDTLGQLRTHTHQYGAHTDVSHSRQIRWEGSSGPGTCIIIV